MRVVITTIEEKHPDRAGVGEALVSRLIEKQFSRWAGLSVTEVASAGTDNAIFRLGADRAVRLPRHRSAAESLTKEWQWLSRLSPSLPLAVPVPIGQGTPGNGFPFPWSVHQWLKGLLAEAFRVLRSGGRLAAFDGDYNTMTVASAEVDPMQSCAAAMAENYVNDPWIVRRLPSMLRSAGFDHIRLRSHGYAQTDDPAYFLSIIDRGADALGATGRIGRELAAALKAEARRRVEINAFF